MPDDEAKTMNVMRTFVRCCKQSCVTVIIPLLTFSVVTQKFRFSHLISFVCFCSSKSRESFKKRLRNAEEIFAQLFIALAKKRAKLTACVAG